MSTTSHAAGAPRPGVALDLEGVSKVYQTREGEDIRAVERVDLRVAPGEFVAIVGPSGCGKSTLLSMVAGLFTPTEGRILLDGERVVRPHPSAGVVFQTDLLLFWRTVLDNVLLPLEIKRRQEGIRCRGPSAAQAGRSGGLWAKYPSDSPGACASAWPSAAPSSRARAAAHGRAVRGARRAHPRSR